MPGFCGVLVLAVCGSTAYAWGTDGHTTVAHVAEKLLTSEADSQLRSLLGGLSLSDASVWNDDYDHQPEGHWSMGLHFINYPGESCNFDWTRDCADDFCVTGAIVNYTRQLISSFVNSSVESRLTALKFVVHMMGDVHQPLHVASKDDEGGNFIKVAGYHFAPNSEHWVDEEKNLHSIWDGQMVVETIYELKDNATNASKDNATNASKDNATLSYARRLGRPPFHDWKVLADYLVHSLKENGGYASQLREWQQPLVGGVGNAEKFRAGLTSVASDTAALGCEYAYAYADGQRVKDGQVLDRSYYLRAMPIVEEQLAKGGARLAQVLSEALVAASSFSSATVLI